MRDLIKILIALAFIGGAFWSGKYIAEENCSIEVEAINSKTESDKKMITRLNDSINVLTIKLHEQSRKGIANGKAKSKKHE